MSKPVETAYWESLTGNSNPDYIIRDGKMYIPVNVAAGIALSFRLKLVRQGIMKLPGLKPDGILDLFTILSKQIRCLKNLQRRKERDKCRKNIITSDSPSPPPQADLSLVIPPVSSRKSPNVSAGHFK